MAVSVHSDGADGSAKTITLEATGSSTGHISITDTAGSTESFDLFDIQADPLMLKMTCKASVFLMNPDVAISVRKGAGKIFADITISHALLGNGTTEYPLRPNEDETLRAFLEQARFPTL